MTNFREIYLDNSATTKISDASLKKYNEVSLLQYGNPSSLHKLGFNAEREINFARDALLASVGAKDSHVIFTSSGSEANNLAILGRAFAKERYKRGAKIITTLGEHASVSLPVLHLKSLGFKVAEIPTTNGKIDTGALISEMTPDVILVSVMMVNNETGALYDVCAIADVMRKNSPEALLHVDATQSYMKVKFTKRSIKADMITLSSHKIEGPKGVGALVIDDKIIKSRGLSPLILGGGQEYGLRSGTENVPGIAAFGAAISKNLASLSENIEKLESLRSYLIEKISTSPDLSGIKITNPESHAPHILNITMPNIKSETVLHYLSSLGIYVSSGSACSSNSQGHTSSALLAYGKTESEADSSIRISFSKNNTREELDALVEALSLAIKNLAKIKR